MLSYRWLGVAGIELRAGDFVLTVDPFFTRLPFWRLWIGRIAPDPALAQEHIDRCDAILVSHPHYDHLLDIPVVAKQTGAMVLGSPNTSALLRVLGTPDAQTRAVLPGDHFVTGPFAVEVLPGKHTLIGGREFASGPVAANLAPPLRAQDYRMDICLSYLLWVNDERGDQAPQSVLLWNHATSTDAPAADYLFVGLYQQDEYYARLARAVQPHVMVLVHWDDLFRPLPETFEAGKASSPKPSWMPPVPGHLPQKANPWRVKRYVEEKVPHTRVEVPALFAVNALSRGPTIEGARE